MEQLSTAGIASYEAQMEEEAVKTDAFFAECEEEERLRLIILRLKSDLVVAELELSNFLASAKYLTP